MKYYIFSLFILSLLTHFIFWGYPNQVVFDEVHFGSFATGYLSGNYFFDVHPPLGKILISAFGSLGQADSSATFTTIGKPFGNAGYLWLRFLPNLAGMLLPIIIFFLCWRLGFSRIASFFAGLFLILENSLLAQSRFILLDSFLLLFGFSGLLFYLIARQQTSPKKRNYLLFLSVILLTFAFSVKWTGLSYFGVVGIIEFIDWYKTHKKWYLVDYIRRFFFFVIIPFLIYFSIFAIHFSLLSKSGPGDAFMSPSFQKTLVGSSYQDDSTIKSKNLFLKFLELNRVIYTSNQTLTASHPYSSEWYTWPLLYRPIYYWNYTSETNASEAKIYLLGNPLIYWLSTVAILSLLLIMFGRTISYKKNRRVFLFLVGGYLLNWLPYIFISRVMFIYHYFASLVFAIMALVFVLDKMTEQKTKVKIWTFSLFATVFLISFLFIAPLTYGFPLIEGNLYQVAWWPDTWR